MTFTLILFLFFSTACTVNRVAHKKEFEREHLAWIEKNYPESVIPVEKTPNEELAEYLLKKRAAESLAR